MPPEEMNLAVFDPIKALTLKMQEEDAALQIDHTTPEGEKELRSYVRTVRGYRAGLEKIRVRAKANSLEYGQAVDKMAKELKAPFDTVIDARMIPLDEIEDVKRKAAEAIVEAERVAAEKIEADKLADLKRREAEVARKEAEIKVAEDAANAEQQAADRVIREKRIADEAAETATKLAEANAKAETERKAQHERDKQARIAAVKKGEDEAEERRVADKNHRAAIHAEIRGELWEFLSGALADKTVEAIIAGKIPHIQIIY